MSERGQKAAAGVMAALVLGLIGAIYSLDKSSGGKCGVVQWTKLRNNPSSASVNQNPSSAAMVPAVYACAGRWAVRESR